MGRSDHYVTQTSVPHPPSVHSYALGQGWPHFLCSGQKNGLKKLGGHKNVSKKVWRSKFSGQNLALNRASLTLK